MQTVENSSTSVVFQIFFGHVDSIFNFPIFKSANELTFAIVDGSNDMRSIYIINTEWKADNLKLIDEVSQLKGNIEELEQYGRRTSLRFHNVPMVQGDLQKTDQLIVDIVNKKLKITPPVIKVAVLFVTFPNFSYLASTLAVLDFTCSFSWLLNWKIKNAIYMSKKNLKNNPEKIFITEDLAKTRQFIVKELNDFIFHIGRICGNTTG
jgi:hypothetical protein